MFRHNMGRDNRNPGAEYRLALHLSIHTPKMYVNIKKGRKMNMNNKSEKTILL